MPKKKRSDERDDAPAFEEAEGRPRIPTALIALIGACAALMGVGGLVRVGLLDLSLPGMFMGLASVMLLLALSALWQSLRSAFGGGPELTVADFAGSLTDRSALEEEKTTLLRAIKDINYEHEVGKISADDFQRLNAAYRQRAKEVLRHLDQDLEPFMEKAEALLRSKRKKGRPRPEPAKKGRKSRHRKRRERAPERVVCPSCEADNEPDADFCKSCANRLAPLVCASCETQNEPDARFCKACATPFERPAEAVSERQPKASSKAKRRTKRSAEAANEQTKDEEE